MLGTFARYLCFNGPVPSWADHRLPPTLQRAGLLALAAANAHVVGTVLAATAVVVPAGEMVDLLTSEYAFHPYQGAETVETAAVRVRQLLSSPPQLKAIQLPIHAASQPSRFWGRMLTLPGFM